MVTISLFLVLALIAICLIRGKTIREVFFYLFALLSALEINRITSTAVVLGGQEINCPDLALAVLFILSLLILFDRKTKVERSLVLWFFVLCSLVVLCIMLNLLIPFDGLLVGASGSWDSYFYGSEVATHVGMTSRTVLVLLRLLVFAAVLLATVATFSRGQFVAVGRVVVNVSKIHIVWGLAELVTKTFANSTIMVDVAQAIFPAESSVYTTIITRGGLTGIQGFTREPSHFAMMLTITALLLVLLRRCGDEKKGDSAWLLLSLAFLLVCGAFTAVVGLVIAACFMVIFAGERGTSSGISARIDVRVILLLFTFLLLLVFVVLLVVNLFPDYYYVEKLLNVVNSISYLLNGWYESLRGSPDAMPRMVSIIECIKVFVSRPMVGIGPGVTNPFSGVVSILVCFGLPVAISWFAFLYAYVCALGDKKGAKLFILYVFLMGLLAYDGGYMYSFEWLLLGGLFAAGAVVTQEKEAQDSLSLPQISSMPFNYGKAALR